MAIDYEALAGEDADGDFSQDTLERLGGLASRLQELEADIEARTAELKELQNEARGIAERDIPGVLDETGLSDVRLTDGTRVVIRTGLNVSTTGKYRGVINKWLEDNGHDDIIKDEFKIPFGKDEDAAIKALTSYLTGTGLQFDEKRYVAPQTFGALVRELMEAGEDVPLDDLGITEWRRAKLEAPRNRS